VHMPYVQKKDKKSNTFNNAINLPMKKIMYMMQNITLNFT